MTSNSQKILTLPDGSYIAYECLPGKVPGVVFLGGFHSDMNGTKATALASKCHSAGRAFVRFDYTGHGISSGKFEEGTIGRWAADAIAILDNVSEGPQVLVGSSMGGWLMLLVALARPDRVVGLVGVASAPDFTEDLIWNKLSNEARATMTREGLWRRPSEYEEADYPITMRLIEEGRNHLLLDGSIDIRCPVRLIHGEADNDVPWQVSHRLSQALRSDDVTLTLVKGGDHRLSGFVHLERIWMEIEELLRQASGERG